MFPILQIWRMASAKSHLFGFQEFAIRRSVTAELKIFLNYMSDKLNKLVYNSECFLLNYQILQEFLAVDNRLPFLTK